MTNPEILLRTILGPVRPSLRPLALAVDIADELLFTQRFAMDDIQAKTIYRDVARLIPCKPEAASRRVERLSHLCWDALEAQGLVPFYVGRCLPYSPDPRALIIYLAVYAHLETPFFTVVEQNPHFLFQSPYDAKPPSDLPGLPVAVPLLRGCPLPVSQVMLLHDSSGPLYFPVCPNCGITLEREYQRFCDRCGQHLSWNHFNNASVIFPGQSLHP